MNVGTIESAGIDHWISSRKMLDDLRGGVRFDKRGIGVVADVPGINLGSIQSLIQLIVRRNN